MSKVLFFPNVMWLCLAMSMVVDSMAVTFPFFPWSSKRNEMKATNKESRVSSLKHARKSVAKDENDIAQPTSVSFLDTHTISDEGYMQVVGLQDDDAMERFIRRLLLAHGKAVNDDGALKGFVPWFSGTKATQSLSKMKEQLFKKPWVVDASDLATNSSPISFSLKRNETKMTERESQFSTSTHGPKQMRKRPFKKQSDRPRKALPAHQQSASKSMRVPYQAEARPESKAKGASVGEQEDAAPSPVKLAAMPHDAERRNTGNNEESGIPTATISAVRQEDPVAVPSPPGLATVPAAATRPGSIETPPAKEDLLLGVRSLVDSQSQIVNDIATKIVELKADAGKADSSNRQSLDEAKAVFQRKLLEQQSNTTRLAYMNKRLDEDIEALVSNNIKLRHQALELKTQSLALRAQVKAAESNLTLAQEFVSKELLDDSNEDFQFLKDLKMNESEVAKARTHISAVNHFGERSSISMLQFENDKEPMELIHTVHTVEHAFSELSVQAEASKSALEQSFEQSLKQEATVQESVLMKQQALRDEREKQLALQSKLTDAVAHAKKMNTYLNNRLLHLRSYALRLSSQY